MTEKDYNFNEFYGRLNTYRNSDQLFLTERVLQSPEVNRLISAQLAKEQINQCEALEELHDADLPEAFLDGFTVGKEYMMMAMEELIADLTDGECRHVTLFSGNSPFVVLGDEPQMDVDSVKDDEMPVELKLMVNEVIEEKMKDDAQSLLVGKLRRVLRPTDA